MFDFEGKTVLVVGGSSGIGNGVARAFQDAGAEVEVWGTRPSADDYANVEGSVLDGLRYTRVDVGDPTAVEAAASEVDRADVVVCSQGIVLYGQEEFGADGWQKVLDVNLNSVATVARTFHSHLQATKGCFIVVSSVAGLRATVGNPAYAASKHGVIGLTKTLGAAWAPSGVRVNGIAPGMVDTKLTKATTASPKRLEATLRMIPTGRLGTPADMAGAALFLASPYASYVCGQTLVIDGGLTLA